MLQCLCFEVTNMCDFLQNEITRLFSDTFWRNSRHSNVPRHPVWEPLHYIINFLKKLRIFYAFLSNWWTVFFHQKQSVFTSGHFKWFCHWRWYLQHLFLELLENLMTSLDQRLFINISDVIISSRRKKWIDSFG